MKILRLTLHKKWFDLIASGKKHIEYREHKPHWISRLMNKGGPVKQFDEIHFANGYGNNRPFMRTGFDGIVTFTPGEGPSFFEPHNGEELTGRTFAIFIGEVLEVRIPRKTSPPGSA